MFSALSEAEREAITVVVFLGTFFVTFGVGRFLKRRAGVKLGLLGIGELGAHGLRDGQAASG